MSDTAWLIAIAVLLVIDIALVVGLLIDRLLERRRLRRIGSAVVALAGASGHSYQDAVTAALARARADASRLH